ncbi:MAG TPA: DUF3795 domain-containing protein [Candidatus Methanofastidiosa archaeon]|nr:DUF3795 domain-containing protein [Candidatus Methanofastidiosa archaeon]HPR42025.1 DUF3795 domain-containing protein [Candidatus Methanofastidiosa archaeon]
MSDQKDAHVPDDEREIAYCGLYCKDCFLRKGEIADMARDLRKALRDEKFTKMHKGLSKYFKELENYETCYETLGALVKFRCKKSCKDGSGNPFCKIRKCAIKKGYDGCWECGDYKDCRLFDSLKEVHGEATTKNLNKLKGKGKEEFLNGSKHYVL